jgi:hypothetical protein
MTLSKDMKGLAAFWTETKYGKMSIDGRDPVNAQTPHYGEAGAIHDGKILVTPEIAMMFPVPPGSLLVRMVHSCMIVRPGI